MVSIFSQTTTTLFSYLVHWPASRISHIPRSKRYSFGPSGWVYTTTPVFHKSGEDKLWMELVGRLSSGPVIRWLVRIPPLTSSDDEEFVWTKNGNQEHTTKVKLWEARNFLRKRWHFTIRIRANVHSRRCKRIAAPYLYYYYRQYKNIGRSTT